MLFFIPYLNGEFDAIYVVNIVTFFTFYLTISKSYYKPESFFTKQRLGYIVFSYLLFFVVVYNSISFYYQGNFWVFSEADAAIYDEGAIKMAAKSFVESIYYALDYWNTDDLGMFLVLSTLYRVVESNLFLNLFYILVGVVTSFSIFRISKNFTSRKYSFLCALTYSISSFVIWFHSSGLKESFLIMLIVSFYDYYYMYLKRRKSSDALCFIISLVAILFFRPVILIFCISSVGFMMLLSLKKGWSTIFIIILAVIVSISMFSYIRLTAENYLRSGDIDQLIQSRDAAGMVSGSVSFTYSVNILASAIGPLPTILPNVKQMLSLFSVGLIYRVFLSVAFWLGLYYSIKEKIVFLYPLLWKL